MSENGVKGVLETTMEKIRSMVDAQTVVGDPIEMQGITLIPISKVTFGIASGGSDFKTKTSTAPMFGGGGGAGVSISPVAFLAVKGSDVKLIPVTTDVTAAERVVAMVPEVFEKIKELFTKDNKVPDISTDI